MVAWQLAVQAFMSCISKRWRVVRPGVGGMGGGTLPGGSGTVPHRMRVQIACPRRTGDDPSLAPVTLRKPASVRMPARWAASNVTALGVVPVMPLTPYTVASAWFTDDLLPV